MNFFKSKHLIAWLKTPSRKKRFSFYLHRRTGRPKTLDSKVKLEYRYNIDTALHERSLELEIVLFLLFYFFCFLLSSVQWLIVDKRWPKYCQVSSVKSYYTAKQRRSFTWRQSMYYQIKHETGCQNQRKETTYTSDKTSSRIIWRTRSPGVWGRIRCSYKNYDRQKQT